MLIEIEKVIVNDRIRKDFGNIEELAQDIKENGLINPPVVTPEFELIAGERRYRAIKSLGWQQIEVRVMSVQDALHKLKLEISENENRKEFSFAERMEWARLLEEELSKKAKENMVKGTTLCSNEQRVNTRKEVAKSIDMSESTYSRHKFVYDNADEETIKNLDECKLSVNRVYSELKNKAKDLEDKTKLLESEKNTLQNQLYLEKKKKPITIDNPEHLKTIELLQKELDDKTKLYNIVKSNEDKHKLLMQSYKQDSENYNNLKREIESLTKQKNSLSRDMAVIEELTPFIHNVSKFIKTDLAPTKYTKAFKEAYHIEVIQNNLLEMVNLVRDWADEIENELNVQVSNKNIINVEVI